MISQISNLFKYRELLYNLVIKDIMGRYKQTVIGAGWAVFQPLAMMVVFTIVFSLFAKVDTANIPYPLFAYSGLAVWAFFSTAISKGITGIVQNVNLVTKIYFPRELLPLSIISSAFVDFIIAVILYFAMALFFGIEISLYILLLPFIVFIQFILIAGLSLFLSAVNVFKRDIGYLVPITLQIWMFLSPVVYPVSLVPERYRGIYMLNPAAGIIEGYRHCLLYGTMPPLDYLAWAAIFSFTLFCLAYVYFKNVEMKFADII